VPDYVLLECAEPDVALPVTRLLESDGYRVRAAVNDAQAAALVRAAMPLLAILDLGERDASELFWLGELRRRYGRHPFPVVLLSSRADLDEQAQRSYAEGWHPKPIDPTGLLALIRTALRQSTTGIGA
jgi:DNA-binding response OmpR family regulator